MREGRTTTGYPGRTVLAFCFVLIALLWAGVALVLWDDRERSIASVIQANANLSRAFEEHVVRTLRNADQTLRIIENRSEESGTGFDLNRYWREADIDSRAFSVAGINDAAGNLVQASLAFKPVNVADREYFQHHAQNDTGEMHISKPIVGRNSGRQLIYLTRRISAKDGSFGGVVVLGLDPQYLSGFYNQIDLGAEGVISLVGRDGIVRARQSGQISAVGQDVRGAPFFAELALNRPVGTYVGAGKVDGVTRIFNYRSLSAYPLVILVGTAEASALAGYSKRKVVFLWSAGVVTALILLFGALFFLQTRRRAALAARLHDAEVRLGLTIERVSDYAIFTLDKRGHVTSWNAGAQRIKAYREDEIIGQHLSRFYPVEDIALGLPERLLAEAASKGSAEHDGWRIRKDGRRFWAHVVITALCNEAGALTGFGKITRDLTSAKLTEDALLRSEARFRAIFDQAGVGIGEVSLQGRPLRVNPRLCEIVGYPTEELLAKNIREITHPDDLDVTNAHALKLAASPGLSHVLEKRFVRKDGAFVWTSLASVLVKGRGEEPDYIVGVVEDISARKLAEIEAAGLHARLEHRVEQRTVELAEANKRLESFSYSVSHDLRTPLRAISGFAQILARRHRESLNDEGRHYMDNIVRASAQMGRLIEDLLNYSRLGRKAVAMEPVALEGVVGDLARQLQPKISEIGGTLRLGVLPPVIGDPTLLTQIFLNLLENALTYRRAEVAPSIEVSARAEGRVVTVSVSDDGIGIDPSHFESIFGIFQRLHSEDEYPGTGIGLATVKQASEILGGQVWVESQPGAGSTFHVRLRGAGASTIEGDPDTQYCQFSPEPHAAARA